MDKEHIVSDVRRIETSCYGSLPEYQCLINDGSGLADKVLAIAYNDHGESIAFSSADRLDVESVGEVLRLGLSCVSQSAREFGPTHKLSSRLIRGLLLRRSPFKRLSVSNALVYCAA